MRLRVEMPPLQNPLPPPPHHAPRHRPPLPKPHLPPPERKPQIATVQRPLLHLPLLPRLGIFEIGFGFGADASDADVAARAHQHGAHDVFEVLFGGGGEVLGAGRGEAVGQGFLEADGAHALGEGVEVGEFEGFAVEGLGVVFADFRVPVYGAGV